MKEFSWIRKYLQPYVLGNPPENIGLCDYLFSMKEIKSIKFNFALTRCLKSDVHI